MRLLGIEALSLLGESGKGKDEVLNELHEENDMLKDQIRILRRDVDRRKTVVQISDQTKIPSLSQVDRASVEKFWYKYVQYLKKMESIGQEPEPMVRLYLSMKKDLHDVTDQDLEDWIVSRLTEDRINEIFSECYMDKSIEDHETCTTES